MAGPGGLTYTQMVRLLRGIIKRGPLAGMDVCEFAPQRDVNDLTALFITRLFMVAVGAARLRLQSGHDRSPPARAPAD